MRRAHFRWAGLLIVAALCGATSAHAQGACDAGDTLLGSKIRHEAGATLRDDTCAKTQGPWSRAELDRVFGVWNSIPDTPAKTWAIKNIGYERRKEEVRTPVCVIGKDGVRKCLPPDASDQMPSPWAGLNGDQAELIFNDRFFAESPAVQRSLFAFESGKALYLKLNLGIWFAKNFQADASAIEEMRVAGKAAGEPNADIDAPSQFGALFRAAMLQIPTAGHPGWQAPLAKLDAMLRRLTPSP